MRFVSKNLKRKQRAGNQYSTENHEVEGTGVAEESGSDLWINQLPAPGQWDYLAAQAPPFESYGRTDAVTSQRHTFVDVLTSNPVCV